MAIMSYLNSGSSHSETQPKSSGSPVVSVSDIIADRIFGLLRVVRVVARGVIPMKPCKVDKNATLPIITAMLRFMDSWLCTSLVDGQRCPVKNA